MQLAGFIQSTGRSGTFGYNCEPLTHPILGNFRAGGSGADYMVEVASKFGALTIDPPDATDYERAVVHGLAMAGGLLAKDFISRESIRDGYGGAYEICTWIGNQFRKVDDILYAWWLANRTESQLSLTPMRLIKLRYVHDWLFVRSIDLVRSSDGHSYTDTTEKVHPLLPEGGEPDFPPSIDLNSRYMCNVVTSSAEGGVRVLSQSTLVGTDRPPVRFSEDERGAITVTVLREFAEDVGRSVADQAWYGHRLD